MFSITKIRIYIKEVGGFLKKIMIKSISELNLFTVLASSIFINV